MEEGLVLDTSIGRGLRYHRRRNNGQELFQPDLEGLGSTRNLWRMVGCELGLGRMAHNIPLNLQHHDPNTSRRAHTSSCKITGVAVSETEVAIPVPIRPRSSSRFRGFSV